MKIPFIFISIVLFSCNSNQHSEPVDDETLNWLVGTWKRSMSGDTDMNHTEYWKKDGSGYVGEGVTTIDHQTTIEAIRLDKSLDQWIYTAHPQQNEKPTSFVVTTMRDSFFRCENNQHDFPTYIEYLRRNDSLFASIGDAQQRITFAFKYYE